MISALISFGFTIFNGVLGILYQSVWNISICIYYVLLAIVRRIIVCSQRKTGDKNQEKEKIKNTYVVTHMILILIDMALVVPIALMVRGARTYTFGMIPAIAMAAYTTLSNDDEHYSLCEIKEKRKPFYKSDSNNKSARYISVSSNSSKCAYYCKWR